LKHGSGDSMTTDRSHRIVLLSGGWLEHEEKSWTTTTPAAPASRPGSGVVPEYLAKLRAVIEATHGCAAVHAVSEPVREEVRQGKIWNGLVEVFSLARHPEANRCYAWGQQKPGGGWEVTTVLAMRPADTPGAAVRSALRPAFVP
jgi:hypothetical protein